MSMFDNIGSNLSLCDGDDDLASEDDLSVFDGFPAGLRSKSRVLLAPVLGIRDIIDSNSFSPMDDLTPIPNAVIEYTTYNRDRFSTRHQVPVSPAADLSLKHPSVSPGPDSINRYSSRDAAPVVKRLPSCAVRPKKKTELPLEIRGSTYAACPDSGSHENIMVHDLALKLGLLVDVSPEHQKEFRLGNGKIVKSLGQATVACSFAKETGVEYACTFYIFQTLIKSIIIGMAFLDATETLTKYKHRLHSMMVPRNGPLQFCVLNNPAQRLHCRVDGKPLLASADTGCEIDLISLAYAKKRLFTFGDELRSSIRQGELRSLMMGKVGMRDSKVQLADGSEAFLEGKVNIDIIIGKKDSSSVDEKALVTRRTFYVLKGLTSDMVLGDEFLDETDAFVTYKAALESDTSEDALSQVNTIVWLKTPERFLGHLFGAHQQAAPEPLDTETESLPLRGPQHSSGLAHQLRRKVGEKLGFGNRKTEAGSQITEESKTTFESRMDARDARELIRREHAQAENALKTGEAKAQAEADESFLVQEYEDDKQRVLQARVAMKESSR